MAEFDPTTPEMRLFDEVDLAPAPQTSTLQRVLNTWREQRADQLLPSVISLQESVASALTPNIFMFSPNPDDQDFSLSRAGDKAIEIFGCKGSGGQLWDFSNRRVAVYARHLFDMARKRREAVCVRFTVRHKGTASTTFEMLAAPVAKGDDADWMFGAVSSL